jgi:hypothetical protein
MMRSGMTRNGFVARICDEDYADVREGFCGDRIGIDTNFKMLAKFLNDLLVSGIS